MIRRKLSLYVTKTKVALRDSGVKHTLRRILEETLLGKLYLSRQFIVYEKQLTELDPVRLGNPNLSFSFVSLDNQDILEQMEKLSGWPQDLVATRLADSGECLVAVDNNGLAGFNLVGYGNIYIHYLDRHLTLSDSEAWSYQIFVSPPYRRSGVATDLRHIMFRHLASKGYTKLLGGYLSSNVKAGMLAESLGFVEREKVTLVKMLNWKRYRVQSLPYL